MVNNNEVQNTLLYHDIFDYPLTKEELWQLLIGKHISKDMFFKQLAEFPHIVSQKNEYYYLANRKSLVAKRIARQKPSEKKIKQAQQIAKLLGSIPSVLFIGISGSVAMHNGGKDDDIDLFVITQKKSVWTTRMLLIMVLQLLGKRRKYGQQYVADMFCLNFLIDETHITLGKNRRDLYTAHEIVQLLPIISKNNTYEKFIKANKWVEEFLPNYKEYIKQKRYITAPAVFGLGKGINMLEPLFKKLQKAYMKRKVTTEVIQSNFVSFHPNDHRQKVLKLYDSRLNHT